MKKVIIHLTALFLIGIFTVPAGIAQDDKQDSHPAIDFSAINFKDKTGETVSMSGFQGKTVVLYFWSFG